VIVSDAGTPAQVTITYTVPSGGTTTPTTTTTTTRPSVPALSAARLRSNKFAANKGTSLMLTLSRPATIAVVVSRTVTGHRVRGVCKPAAKKGKRCTISVKERALIFVGVAGRNTLKLTLPRLKKGRHSLTITAKNQYGRSSPIKLTFTITGR
jgi:hypothetical protein